MPDIALIPRFFFTPASDRCAAKQRTDQQQRENTNPNFHKLRSACLITALGNRVLKRLLDHLGNVAASIAREALLHQQTYLVTSGGRAVESGRGVVSVSLLNTNLSGQSSDVVTAVSLSDEVSVNRTKATPLTIFRTISHLWLGVLGPAVATNPKWKHIFVLLLYESG